MKREFKQETLRDLSIAKYATYKANGVTDVFIAKKYEFSLHTLQKWKLQNWWEIGDAEKAAAAYDPIQDYLQTIQDLMKEVERLTAINDYLKRALK